MGCYCSSGWIDQAMSRVVQRLFKRPRHPRQWPFHVYVLLALLIVVVIAVGFLVIYVKPSKFPPTDEPNQWAAEAAIISGGALFFAVVATAIAVVAYVNSTEKPALELFDVLYPGSSPSVPLHADSSVIEAAEPVDWWLTITLRNNGPIAARFAAIHLTAGARVHFVVKPSPHAWRPLSQSQSEVWELWWEGGADTVLHPGWLYRVPDLAPVGLVLSPVGLDASKIGEPMGYDFTITVVADDVAALMQTFTIRWI